MTLANELERIKPRLKAVAPRSCDVDELIANVSWAVAQDQDLSRCSTRSLIEAVMEALAMGLDPSGLTGDGTLIPRRTKSGGFRATFVPDYRALLKLALAHPRIAHIEARVVRAADDFAIDFGAPNGRIIHHRPSIAATDGDPIGAYAIAWFRDAPRPLAEWMTKAEIDANAERGGGFGTETGPWETDWPEMARKTVIKRLLKYIPLADRRPANAPAAPRNPEPAGDPSSQGTAPEGPNPAEVKSADVKSWDRYRAMIERAGKADIPTIAAALRADESLDSSERSELFQLLNARQKELKGGRTDGASRAHAEVG